MGSRIYVRSAVVVAAIVAACGGSSLAPSTTDQDAGSGGAPLDAAIGDTLPAATSCVPGESVACVGPGGCSTSQVCTSDGSGYGPCDCLTGDAGAPACVPGQSVACVGPGGCSTNQTCTADGHGFGPCVCTSTDASSSACVPGQSIACAGPGGCISSQVCSADGQGYGPCACAGDGGALSCIPGQSVACSGPFGCPSFQICNPSGTAYGPCDCPDGGILVNDGGDIPDGYAPLPPPVGHQGYNAIWSAKTGYLFLPLFSAPNCSVIPPYGQFYAVAFPSTSSRPVGTFPACTAPGDGPGPCYSPEVISLPPWNFSDFEDVPGGVYTLSSFDGSGIAQGQMNTREGIVPLVVKNCP